MPPKGKRPVRQTTPTFVEKPASPIVGILTPSSAGAITSAALAFSPGVLPQLPGANTGVGRVLAAVPDRLYGAVIGFAVGYGATRSLAWLRQQILKSLLTYTGWIYNSRSRKTKIWALLLKLLRGPGPHHTLYFQSLLPAQPLPDLDASLERWLLVLEPLLTPAEHEATREAVEQFRKNEGPQLQAYLKKRVEEKVNWLSEYWLTAAYLTGRAPIAINSNFYVANRIHNEVGADALSRAAQVTYYSCKMERYIAEGRLTPSCLQDLVPLCMSGPRFLFNSARLPGEYMDMLAKESSGNKHIVVIRKSNYFKMDMYAPGANGKPRMLTQQEIYSQLEKIMAEAETLDRLLPVAALTSQNRTLWWKQREQLALKNKETLALVEDGMFILVLDEHYPKDKDEHASLILTGSGDDRWFDKSFNTVIFEDASGGANVEHSVIDATVMGQLFEYCMYNEEYNNGKLKVDAEYPEIRDLENPKILSWDLTGMEENIKVAMKSYKELAANMDMKVLCTRYGREAMKKTRTSPDAYVQMSLQLAYYRMHKEITKTYEPSTGRLFKLGRTETIHPVSVSSVAWVKSMDDPKVTVADRVKLLRDSAKYHTAYRLDATVGLGCDRHLLGLYCASRELGMDIPAIYRDKGWQLPFKLSTSQTPTRFYEWGLDLDVDQCGGGFAPTVEDGYGIAYFHVGDEQVNIHISSWNSCPTTSSRKFVQTLDQALQDMKALFD